MFHVRYQAPYLSIDTFSLKTIRLSFLSAEFVKQGSFCSFLDNISDVNVLSD